MFAAALLRQGVVDRRALRTLGQVPIRCGTVSGRARLGDGARQEAETHRPIDGATPGAGAFEERIVEVRETAEESVITKTTRVVEEVVIEREATERTETVKDAVRREDVEVSKDGEAKP